MNPQIKSTEEMHFVGVSDTFISILSPDATNFTVIPALWSRFNEVCEQVPATLDNLSYGVIYADAEPERPDELRYIAALRVSSPWSTDGDLVGYSTDASLYAIVEHRGPVSGLGNTLREFRQWLESSKYTQSVCVEIEVYPPNYDPCGEDSVMETWISVTEKK